MVLSLHGVPPSVVVVRGPHSGCFSDRRMEMRNKNGWRWNLGRRRGKRTDGLEGLVGGRPEEQTKGSRNYCSSKRKGELEVDGSP